MGDNIGSLNIVPFYTPVSIISADTSSREENVAGLSSAITLVNEIRSDLINHFANATRHTAGLQSVVGIPVAAINKSTVISLTATLLTAYAAHNADAILAAAWVYHSAQSADNALVSAVAPTTLEGSITKLLDLKAKWNAHETVANTHDGVASVVADQVAAADAAYGTANFFPVTNVLSGDVVNWSILNEGSGNVTGVNAVAGNGGITFTFSADPQNDCIISYSAFRPAN